jgi:ribosome biogenesis GTPase
VSRHYRAVYQVIGNDGEKSAQVTGRLLHLAEASADLPAIGDWVATTPMDKDSVLIHKVLPRGSCLSRNVAASTGRTEEQVLAANVDVAFLVSGLDDDFNLRRIERYLTGLAQTGITPVIVLNKADLCADVDRCREEAARVAGGTPLHVVSARKSNNVVELLQYFTNRKTAVFLGSSGVGKSSLINCLLGENRLATGEVRSDDSRGRHTTTHRELLVLPQGGVVIDTPGLRELSLWSESSSVAAVFDDIEALAAQCRFRDCRHKSEPGCAILAALDSGELDSKRWNNYLKLQAEEAWHRKRMDARARRQRDRQWSKRISSWKKEYNKLNKDGDFGRKLKG